MYKKGTRKTIIILLSILIISALLTGCGNNTSSQPAGDNSALTTRQPGKLTVGFCATWPPFEYRNDKAEIVGFDVDMAKELGKDLGLEVVFKDADWQGLVPSLQKGDYDILITCFAASEKRSETVAFTDSYYDLSSSIVVMKSNNTISEPEDLAGKIVGVQLGTADEMAAEKLNKSLGFKELKKYKLPPDEFMDLQQGGIDAVIVGYPYAIHNIKESGNFKIIGEPFDPQKIVMVVNSENQELLQAVNDSLARIKSDGTYDQLAEKWLSL